MRKNSMAFGGGAYGDEGKGRIVDEYAALLSKKHKMVIYRDNGGSNAGHTVEVPGKAKIALHQLPSGVFVKGATVILGKGMVINPADLLEEIRQVKKVSGNKLDVTMMIDEMAVLTLDTHRAFEGVLKKYQEGGKGSTGRGISPAYADVLLRHPLRARDIKTFNNEKILSHYRMYRDIIKGLGEIMETWEVKTLGGSGTSTVGSEKVFLDRLLKESKELKKYISDVSDFLKLSWNSKSYAFIFEKAQAVGLDPRYGVYPDVTASDTTFGGIESSTEGIVNPMDIETRASVIKATYMSSVGTRKLPSMMTPELAHRIREDANEYGATTKRPRDIAYLDLVATDFFRKVGKATHMVLTHMDIVYKDTPVKVCIGYTLRGKKVTYRPDQEFLNKVKPVYKDFKTWDKEKVQKAKKYKDLPKEAKDFLTYISKYLEVPVLMITTGPKREQGIRL